MLWKLGWLVKSLKYSVEKDIRETLFKNDEFLKNRWSLSERIFIWGAKHVFISNFILFLIAASCFFIIGKNYALIQTLLPQTFNGLSPLIEFQSTIFGAQVTLLGLVFPLVIAFIGILLQGKSSNESMWVIYRHSSGFMLVGFSALTLSFSFVLLKLYQPWLTHQFLVAGSVSITGWFLANLLLSVRFLWTTVAFLELNLRMEMVVKYTINEVVPTEIKNRLLYLNNFSAIEKGLLISPKNDCLEVNKFPANNHEKSIFRQFAKQKRINNVWYRILNLGVWFLSIQTKFQKSKNGPITLSLTFNVDSSFSKELILAKTNCDDVNRLSKIFIKVAVRTTTKPVNRELTHEQVIGALYDQLEIAQKDNNTTLFDTAKANLIHIYLNVLLSMMFINDDNEPDNWLLLHQRLFGWSFLDEFVMESTKIAKDGIQRIQENFNYYQSWCDFFPRLFDSLISQQKKNIPSEIAEKYINGHYLLWKELMSWMVSFNKNDNFYAQQRDAAIKQFVGSWERWYKLIRDNFESVKSKDFEIALHHLNYSSCLIINACKYNNNDAAIWATDVLSYWFKLFSNSNIGYHYYGWNHELITTKTLELDCEHSLLKSLTCNNDFSEVEAATIGLRNYWTDLRCLTAAYLLATSHNDKNEYKTLIDALVSGNHLESTKNIEINHSPITSSKDILGVYLRQYGCWESQSDYTKLMEQHLTKLAKIEEPEWIPGRVYSAWGTKRDLYLPDFFRVMGIGLTKSQFKIDSQWLNFLKSDSICQTELESTISSLKSLTEIESSTISAVSDYFGIGQEKSKEQSNFFIKSINEIIAELESTISENINGAQIDKHRLLKFGVVSSESTFTLSRGPIPVTLFDDIEYIDNFESNLVTTKITDYNKSYVSQNIEVNRACNENEWLHDIVSQRMQTTCFQQLLGNNLWKEEQFEDTKNLILRAVEDSQSIGTPIMFIGSWDVYKLIDSSRWKYGRQDKRLPLDILVESNKPDEYICHVAGIEIYRLPFSKVDYSILVSKEAFRKINFKQFEKGRYVDANFTTESAGDLKGTLSLEFGVECKFNKKAECFKYISLNPDE